MEGFYLSTDLLHAGRRSTGPPTTTMLRLGWSPMCSIAASTATSKILAATAIRRLPPRSTASAHLHAHTEGRHTTRPPPPPSCLPLDHAFFLVMLNQFYKDTKKGSINFAHLDGRPANYQPRKATFHSDEDQTFFEGRSSEEPGASPSWRPKGPLFCCSIAYILSQLAWFTKMMKKP